MGQTVAHSADQKSGNAGLGWLSIARLGLVQAALGAIVVLTTSTLNRVMIVELGLAAVIPGCSSGSTTGSRSRAPSGATSRIRGGPEPTGSSAASRSSPAPAQALLRRRFSSSNPSSQA